MMDAKELKAIAEKEAAALYDIVGEHGTVILMLAVQHGRPGCSMTVSVRGNPLAIAGLKDRGGKHIEDLLKSQGF